MPIPTRPTAPDLPLRSEPSTFNARIENWIVYLAGLFPNWVLSIAGYIEGQAQIATSAAAAAGAAEGFDLEGQAGRVIQVRSDETGTTFGGTPVGLAVLGAADTPAAQIAIGGTSVGRAVFTAASAAAARQAVGSPTIVVSTAAPSGGVDGDVWLQY
jgi:hypothetical protein